MAKVLVSIPNQGWIHKLVMHAAMRIVSDRRHDLTLITPTWKPYEHNMNRIAKDFLAQGYDYWLNIDADNPPKGNPLDAIYCGYDVVGFPTPVWRDDCEGLPFYWNAMTREDDGYLPADLPPNELVEVDAVGSGCILFNREVIKTVRGHCGPPFIRTIDADGLVEYGPDFLFCQRAKALGKTIAADTRCPCTHFVEIDMFSLTQRVGHG